MAGKILLLLTRKISIGNGKHRRCHGNQKRVNQVSPTAHSNGCLPRRRVALSLQRNPRKYVFTPRMKKEDGEGNRREGVKGKKKSKNQKSGPYIHTYIHTNWTLMLL